MKGCLPSSVDTSNIPVLSHVPVRESIFVSHNQTTFTCGNHDPSVVIIHTSWLSEEKLLPDVQSQFTGITSPGIAMFFVKKKFGMKKLFKKSTESYYKSLYIHERVEEIYKNSSTNHFCEKIHYNCSYHRMNRLTIYIVNPIYTTSVTQNITTSFIGGKLKFWKSLLLLLTHQKTFPPSYL